MCPSILCSIPEITDPRCSVMFIYLLWGKEKGRERKRGREGEREKEEGREGESWKAAVRKKPALLCGVLAWHRRQSLKNSQLTHD